MAILTFEGGDVGQLVSVSPHFTYTMTDTPLSGVNSETLEFQGIISEITYPLPIQETLYRVSFVF